MADIFDMGDPLGPTRVREENVRTLHERGVVVVPAVIANAGGVICAAKEFRGAIGRGPA